MNLKRCATILLLNAAVALHVRCGEAEERPTTAKLDPAKLKALVAELGSENYETRQAAPPKFYKLSYSDQLVPMLKEIAASQKDAEVLAQLNKIIGHLDRPGMAYAHTATGMGYKELLVEYLAKNPDVNQKNGAGESLLHIAAIAGRVDILELLLSKNADVNARNRQGFTPLMYAKDGAIAKMLIARGANINEKADGGTTALSWAASWGKTDIVKVLLENGADVKGGKDANDTPLHWAKNKDTVELLLAKGASLGKTGENTPLHTAADQSQKEVAEALIAHGADVNAVNGDGWTPLHCASRSGCAEILKMLVAKGANVNATDRSGRTPLHILATNKRTELIDFLISKGANPTAQDADRRSVLEVIKQEARDPNQPMTEAEANELKRAAMVKAQEQRKEMERELNNGTAEMLQNLDPLNVASLQIMKLEWPKRVVDVTRKGLSKRSYMSRPLEGRTPEDVEVITALLATAKRAEKYNRDDRELESIPDRVLVIRPYKGEPFEIKYSSYLRSPIAGVFSKDLKEALYFLSENSCPVTLMYLEGGEIKETIPTRTGTSTGTTSCGMRLTDKDGLVLHVKRYDGDKVLLDDKKPMHYGESKVFGPKGTGTFIILLHEPE